MSYPHIFFDHTVDSGKMRVPNAGIGQIECFHRLRRGDEPKLAGPLEERVNEILSATKGELPSANELIEALRSAPKNVNKSNLALLQGMIAESLFVEKRFSECVTWYENYKTGAENDPRFYFFSIKSMIALDRSGQAVDACNEILRAISEKKYIFIALKGVAQRRAGQSYLAAKCFADAAGRKYDYDLATGALGFIANRITPEEAKTLIPGLKKGAEESRSPNFHHALSCIASRAGDEAMNALHLSKSLLLKNRQKIENQHGRPNPEKLSEPHFLILGLAKCGTSSVYEKICTHPHVLPAARKELHFFIGANSDKSMQWYLSNFPNFLLASGKPFITGEATPGYFSSKEAFEKISTSCPTSKLLVIFRNPTARTISSYYQRKKMQGLKLSLEQFVRQHLETADTEGVVYENHYVDRLKMWEAWRGKGNIHITCAERMFDQGKQCMDSIFEFLGLDPELVTERFPAVNRGAYPDAPEEILELLDSHFAPWNERLFEHLGDDFGWNEVRR